MFHLFVRLFGIHLIFRTFICLFIHSFVCLFICLFSHSFVCSLFCLLTHWFLCFFVHLSSSLFICLFICLFVCLFVFFFAQLFFIHSFSYFATGRVSRRVALDPAMSKCEKGLEICCRHPDWRDVPPETYVEIGKPSPNCKSDDAYDEDYYSRCEISGFCLLSFCQIERT